MHSTDEITKQFGGLGIGTADCVPFRPANSARWRHLQLSPLPRFLFRVSTPKSDGSTDESWAKSRDAVTGLPSAAEDIFQSNDLFSATFKLTAHLWWYRRARDDNMLSWTSSLLFAIQYMFFRHRMPDDSSPLDEIRLYIVDTAKFESGTFIRDMDLIQAFSDNNEHLKRLETLRNAGTHYYGEYLSQGALKIEDKCNSVSAQAMLESGLASLRPEFGSWDQGENGWANTVVRIRQQLSFEKEQQQNVSAEQAEVALTVSQLFGPIWRLQVAINLLALLPGQLKVNNMKSILISGNRFKDFEFRECDSTSIVPYEEMPEVLRAEKILRIICTVQNQMRVKDCLGEAESSIRRATMCALEMEDGITSLSDDDRSYLLDRVHQVAFVSRELEELVGGLISI